MLTGAYQTFYCHWELAALKEENEFVENPSGRALSCKPCFCHTQRRRGHLRQITFPVLLFKCLNTMDSETRGTEVVPPLGKLRVCAPSIPLFSAECYGQGVWLAPAFEAEVITESWRRAKEHSDSFFSWIHFFFQVSGWLFQHLNITIAKSEDV